MNRSARALSWLLALIGCFLLSARTAVAQPTITAQVYAVTVNGVETATDNSQFIFRATVDPGANQVIVPLSGNNYVAVVIDPQDNANPEFGAYPPNGSLLWMRQDPTNPPFGWYTVVPGSQIGTQGGLFGSGGFPSLTHRWSVVGRNNTTGGVLNNGTGASPKPAGSLVVVAPQQLQIMPVDENFLPDKRLITGQPGNGLRIEPADPTAPNDGGSSHIYTWRVRLRLTGALPPEYFLKRAFYEWRDLRPQVDQNPPFPALYNSGVVMVLVSPDGTRHYCPMEIDPDAPGQGGLQQTTYPVETWPNVPGPANTEFHPVGGQPLWNQTGVFFRYRMVPSQYVFNHGTLRGEGPFTAFGGPTQPDGLPAIPLGWGSGADGEPFAPGNEVIGRPYANEYTAFAGPDRAPFGPTYPIYTDVLQRAGQWKYYYIATTDIRPPQRAGFPANFHAFDLLWPSDDAGSDPDAYLFVYDSDAGASPGDPSLPYLHPIVTPMLSDGGWTDDIPENGYQAPAGVTGPTHRSRVTTKTRVRFTVRLTLPDQFAQPFLVKAYIDGADGAHAHGMQPLPIAGNNDYTKGVVYYYDVTFPIGQEGKHWVFFEADDGQHRSIWPRRDVAAPLDGTGDGRFFDLQANVMPAAKPDTVNFGTQTVGKNFLDEPRVNSKPVLLSPSVTPANGAEHQSYTYSVNFYDADGDEPLDSWVIIDGIFANRMTAADTNATNFAPGGVPTGRKYTFVLTDLIPTTDRKHNYFFRFRDNWNSLAAYNISPIRREYGEYVTLPAGDDAGNPSGVIAGPTIVGNQPATLDSPQVFASDQANTPATKYDFAVRYRDAENQAPASIKVYTSADGGQTWDGGTSMVPAENSNNYSSGVQFHLPTPPSQPTDGRKQFPANSVVKYKFIVNDSVQDTSEISVGDQTNYSTAKLLANPSNDGVTFQDLVLVGTQLKPTTQWDPTGTLVWKVTPTNPPTVTLLTNGVDYTVDTTNGIVHLNSAITAGQQIKATYLYTVNPGPVVVPNHPPVLAEPGPTNVNTNNGTITAITGQPGTTFTYTIIYTDLDNQAPVDSQGNVNSIDLFVDANPKAKLTPATSAPYDFTRGVKFTATVTGASLGIGSHSYHFETTDGYDSARWPLSTAQQTELPGPTIADVSSLVLPPTGSFIEQPINPFPRGKENDTYVFTVVYKSANGVAPPADIETWIGDANGVNFNTAAHVKMNPIDPIGPTQYQTGVRYQVQLTSPNTPLTQGVHYVQFGFSNNPVGIPTGGLKLTVNKRPTLTNPLPTGNPTYSQSGDITFSVLYTDLAGDDPRVAPAYIRMVVDFGTGTQRTYQLQPAPATPNPPDFTQGVTFQLIEQAKNFAIGNHTFRFEAGDTVEPAATAPVPDGTFTVVAAQPFTLTEPSPNTPATNNGTLTPVNGARAAAYTFAITYTHPDNVPPVSIQVVINEGTNQITRNLTPIVQNPNYAQGVVYSYVTQPNELGPGPHSYYFTAQDRLITVTKYMTGSTPYSGPLVNNPPALTNGTAYLQGTQTPPTLNGNNALTPAVSGNTLSQYVFQVTYTDPDNVAPTNAGYVRATLDNGTVLTLHPQSASPNYTGPVVYVSNPVTLPAGARTVHFDASDGLDATRFPSSGEISGITVHNLPVLSAPQGGTLTPTSGPLSTTFTYRVQYAHADNGAPTSVKIFIDGAAGVDMTPETSGTNYSGGVVYKYTKRFSAGTNHTYHFEAVDGFSPNYTAKLPTDGSNFSGPTVNIPTFATPSFNPTPGVAGQPLSVTGQLVATFATANQVAIQFVKPDGSGVNAGATLNPDGTFTYPAPASGNTFIPDETGDWKVKFSWAGLVQNGQTIYDPVSAEFPFKVTGFQMTLNSGALDMIASPLIPVTPDPSITFGLTDPGTGNPLPITTLNLIKWDPTAGIGGRYLILNQDASFPGIAGGNAYWIQPSQNVVLSPHGKLWDQTQPYSIPLNPGWNMIGSVYLQDINWSAVKVRYQGNLTNISASGSLVRPVAWAFDPATGGYQMIDQTTGVLHSGRGYWVRAFQPVELVIYPPGTRAAEVSRDAVDRTASIQIAARTGNRADTETYAPVTGTTAATVGLMEKPPYVSNYVSVKMLDSSKVTLPDSTRAAAAGNPVIAFQVDTDRKNQDVTLQFPNLSTLGRKYSFTLVDLTNNNRQSLGTSAGYTYPAGTDGTSRKFALIVTRLTGNQLRISNVTATSRGPAGTSFNFTLSGSATVRAQIIGGAGSSTVRELSTGRAATAGVNELMWDGKNSQGIAVPAGAYMLKLTAKDDEGHQASIIAPVTLVR